jgi:hypothetical protein
MTIQKPYTQDNWQFEKHYFVLGINGHGHYWPTMLIRNEKNPQHPYPIYIRDSSPFKTLKAAVKFVENYINAEKLRESHE